MNRRRRRAIGDTSFPVFDDFPEASLRAIIRATDSGAKSDSINLFDHGSKFRTLKGRITLEEKLTISKSLLFLYSEDIVRVKQLRIRENPCNLFLLF